LEESQQPWRLNKFEDTVAAASFVSQRRDKILFGSNYDLDDRTL
jgi:hypothetical protein